MSTNVSEMSDVSEVSEVSAERIWRRTVRGYSGLACTQKVSGALSVSVLIRKIDGNRTKWRREVT